MRNRNYLHSYLARGAVLIPSLTLLLGTFVTCSVCCTDPLLLTDVWGGGDFLFCDQAFLEAIFDVCSIPILHFSYLSVAYT